MGDVLMVLKAARSSRIRAGAHAGRVSAFVAAVCVLLQPVPAARARQALLRIWGAKLTVRHATGVGYQEGLNLCERAFRRWGGAGAKIHATSPLPFGWAPPQVHRGWIRSAAQMHRDILQGVVGIALEREVMLEVCRQQGVAIGPIVAACRPQRLARLGASARRRLRLLADGLADGRISGWHQYRGAFGASFPHAKRAGRAAWRYYIAQRNNPGACFVGYHAARSTVGTGPARWISYRAEAAMMPLVVIAAIEAHKRHYAALAAKNISLMSLITADGVPPSRGVRHALGVAAAIIGKPDGGYSADLLRHFNVALRIMGSPTNLRRHRWLPLFIAADFSVKLANVHFGGTLCQGLKSGWLRVGVVYQRHSVAFRNAPCGPGTWLFAIAEPLIVRRAVTAVLAAAKAQSGIGLPSVATLNMDCSSLAAGVWVGPAGASSLVEPPRPPEGAAAPAKNAQPFPAAKVAPGTTIINIHWPIPLAPFHEAGAVRGLELGRKKPADSVRPVSRGGGR